MLETQLKILALKLHAEHDALVVIQMISNIFILILMVIMGMKIQN